nr:HK97 family phage prohead protease [Moritella viscosa]SHO17767.1 Sb5 [Moritella viscosa]
MTIKQQAAFKVKSFDPETGCFEGYANTFDFKDHAWDITQKGAFITSLEEHKQAGTMPKMFWHHKRDEPIGVWTEMYEDEHGLYAKGRLVLEVTKAKEAHALMKAGALGGLSIGYRVVREMWNNETDANELHEVKLDEVSVVTMACNEESKITAVKSCFEQDELPTERQMEKALRELGLSRKQAKSFLVDGYKSFTATNDTLVVALPTKTTELNNTVDTKAVEELLHLLKSVNGKQ